MKNKQTVYGNCWIAYFDILGFKKLIRLANDLVNMDYEIAEIIEHYKRN